MFSPRVSQGKASRAGKHNCPLLPNNPPGAFPKSLSPRSTESDSQDWERCGTGCCRGCSGLLPALQCSLGLGGSRQLSRLQFHLGTARNVQEEETLTSPLQVYFKLRDPGICWEPALTILHPPPSGFPTTAPSLHPCFPFLAIGRVGFSSLPKQLVPLQSLPGW
uniref:Uncharacterized protein n=1 Tax=Falco tinnunculus TaxID=100819 RepID=A0A8C4V769_FALTI